MIVCMSGAWTEERAGAGCDPIALVALAEKSGRIASYHHLARRIWGGPGSRGRDDVRLVMTALRKKIEVDEARPKFIKNDAGIGYRLGRGTTIHRPGGADLRRVCAYDSTKTGP